MLITSPEFLLFLLISVVTYYALPQKFRWIVLLLSSVLFYCSFKAASLIYLGLTTVITYLFARWLCKLSRAEFDRTLHKDAASFKKSVVKRKRVILSVALILDFSSLVVLKYSGFFAQLSNNFLRSSFPVPSFFLPLGISFYVFQSAGYLIDVYREKYQAQKNPAKYALFICYFPQMIQGPINRYDAMEKQLYGGNPFCIKNLQKGFYCIMFGLLKKSFIADPLRPIVDEIYTNYGEYPGVIALMGAALYCLQLYCDFSGGIDMVQGASWMFGIKMHDNFMQPYFATGLADFWRRWHISLGEWMKDYLFMPLVLSKRASKINKFVRRHLSSDLSKRIVPCLGTFAVFIAVGMWQGPGMQNIAYGIWNGFWMSLGMLWTPVGSKLDKVIHYKKHKRFMLVKGILVTNLLVVIGRYFSNASSLRGAVGMLLHTVNSIGLTGLGTGVFTELGFTRGVVIGLAIFSLLLLAVSVAKENKVDVTEWICTRKWIVQYIILVVLFAVVVFGIFANKDYVPISFVYEAV